ncbi:Heterogeneous nuclear ribonucleoprotein A0 [Oryzias melastigma]|uniref:Heterogeneous nuclear ribonucleoprotein A0 n=1 Tax=Oryzias melastigma TaxID=30732 RepID=A0A834FFA6_ORYME|nr:Heterogeneous nuclear ribonucleoprotein A0 [Oryzias melastigma]
MEKKIFVGGLKNDIFEFQLTEYFSQYGQVEKSEIMKDHKRTQPRRLQEIYTGVMAPNPSSCHSTVEDKDVVLFMSSQAFLNFKFDRVAIMKCFDV